MFSLQVFQLRDAPQTCNVFLRNSSWGKICFTPSSNQSSSSFLIFISQQQQSVDLQLTETADFTFILWTTTTWRPRVRNRAVCCLLTGSVSWLTLRFVVVQNQVMVSVLHQTHSSSSSSSSSPAGWFHCWALYLRWIHFRLNQLRCSWVCLLYSETETWQTDSSCRDTVLH